MAKVEVITFMHLARVEMLLEDVVGKLVGSHQRKIARKRQQQNCVQLSRRQQAKFFRGRSQQFEYVIGTKNARRMRIKSNDDRSGARGPGAAHDLVDHGPVCAVDAVEVADAHDRRTEVRGDVCELVEDLHR